MNKRSKWIIGGIVAALVVALVAMGVGVTGTALAQVEDNGQALTSGHGPWGGRGDLWGGRGGFGGEIDRQALLAEALGISVEELEAAQAEAQAAAVAEAVELGYITEEQADLMTAMAALKGAIDHEALVAEALGISVEELQAAQEEGASLRDLVEEQGLDTETMQANMQAAYEAAIDQAVSDGIITQAQADLVLSQERPGFGLFGGRGHHGRGGPRGFGPGAPGSDTDNGADATTESSST